MAEGQPTLCYPTQGGWCPRCRKELWCKITRSCGQKAWLSSIENGFSYKKTLTLVFEVSQKWICYSYVASFKNLDILSLMIDTQKLTHNTLQDTKENVLPEAYSGLQTYMVTRSIWGYFEKPIVTSSWNCSAQLPRAIIAAGGQWSCGE